MAHQHGAGNNNKMDTPKTTGGLRDFKGSVDTLADMENVSIDTRV